jgi:hypothetical protein
LVDGFQGGDGAVEGFGGEVAESLDLVETDSGGAKELVWSVEEELWRGVVVAVEGAEAAVNGGGGLAVELLVND